MIAPSKYFYDKQLRRYMLQVARIFSGYQVRDGYEVVNGERVIKYKTVPVAHANLNRLGATYLSDNSENVMSHAPAMAFYISDLQPYTEFRHYQHQTTSTRFTEKEKNASGDYVNVEGKKYEVSQVMPTPFDMKITLDIWTSSMEQKMELLEQILVYYNPGFAFRVNSSRFDMGQLSNMELESIQWSSKGVPIGSSTELEFATLTFRVYPVFISAPAKITRQNVIKSISLGVSTTDTLSTMDDIFANAPTHRMYVTPHGYSLEITKESINGVKRHVARLKTIDSDDSYSWEEMFKSYGVDQEGSCLIRIRQTEDIDEEDFDVYANIEPTGDDEVAILSYDTETFKTNSLRPIQYIISGTNSNTALFDSDNGTRIIIASDMDVSNTVWNMEVVANSIIEKVDGVWEIMFTASTATKDEYVLNSNSNEQYKFVFGLGVWQPTMIGMYNEGYWSFDIQKVIKK